MRVLVSAFCLLLVCGLYAQPNLKKIEKYIEEARIKYDVPGLSVGIVKDGKVFLNKGFGVKEMGTKDAVDENTLYAIASNTKAFLASVLANLVDQGKLSWEDRVVDHIPYFELYDPYVSREIRIKDLLCHRSGLGTFSGDMIWYKSELTPPDLIKRLKHLPQAFGFRNGYGYSNLMFITAGEVIQVVTGKSWSENVDEMFFQPLGMTRSTTSTNALEEIGNFATPHKTYLNENTPIDWVNWDNMGAAGGIISSVKDMSQWMIMNLNEGIVGDDALIDPDQQNLLWTMHNVYTVTRAGRDRLPGRNFNGYGLGWGIQDHYGRRIVSHGGGYDGMYSRVILVPEEKLGIVILTNSMSGISGGLSMWLINQFTEEDQRDWVAEYYQEQSDFEGIKEIREAKMAGTSPSLALADYTGAYDAALYGGIEISEDQGKLRLTFEYSPALSATLEHWHNDTWEIKWDEQHAWFDFGLVSFDLNDQLEVTGMKINVPNGDIFFDELAIVKR